MTNTKPITRRTADDELIDGRFGVLMCWDGFRITAAKESIDEVNRIIDIVRQLQKEHPDLYAHMNSRVIPQSWRWRSLEDAINEALATRDDLTQSSPESEGVNG
jgi:hypothetical protein